MTGSSTTSVSLPLVRGRWAVDTNHSFIGFSIRHLGVSWIRGRFTRFDAEVLVGDTLDTTTITAIVDVASIDTANSDRDKNVLSPALIDVAKRPVSAVMLGEVVKVGLDLQRLEPAS